MFNLYSLLKLPHRHIIKALGLNDILKTTFVTISVLQLVQQVQLVVLEFLDALVERRNRGKHLIVFGLELITLNLGLLEQHLRFLQLHVELSNFVFLVVEVRLDVLSGCNGLNCQLFLAVPLHAEIFDLLFKVASDPAGLFSLFLCRDHGLFDLNTSCSLSLENFGQEEGVLFDLVERFSKHFLVLNSLFELRVVVLIKAVLLGVEVFYFFVRFQQFLLQTLNGPSHFLILVLQRQLLSFDLGELID